MCGECNSQLWYIVDLEPHPVKPVGDVDLGQVDRTVAWVCMDDAREHALQCASELHGLSGGGRYGVGIQLGV